jgi:hypothetical protein
MANKLNETKALLADLSSERAQLDAAIEEMVASLARTKPANCHIPPRRTLPRRDMQHSQISWKAARIVRRRSTAVLGRT